MLRSLPVRDTSVLASGRGLVRGRLAAGSKAHFFPPWCLRLNPSDTRGQAVRYLAARAYTLPLPLGLTLGTPAQGRRRKANLNTWHACLISRPAERQFTSAVRYRYSSVWLGMAEGVQISDFRLQTTRS